MNLIAERVHTLQSQIRAFPSAIIIAVTKYATPAQMIAAYDAGLHDFGENKVQDALYKQETLPEEVVKNIRWHFIGRLQSNKIKKIIGKFSLIHSVDRIPLAQEISRLHAQAGLELPQQILLQVNMSGERTKQGFSAVALPEAIDSISSLPGVKIRGFMTIAPKFYCEPQETQNPDFIHRESAPEKNTAIRYFSGLRECRDKMEKEFGQTFPELSMGMTQDYMQALACGATMVRIGSYLFDMQRTE